MQQLRTTITRLKNKIREKLPDGQDILGYSGVSKEALVTYLEEAHGLTNRIEILKGTFSIVTLKRKIEPWIDICNSYFEKSQGTKNETDDFDKFLRAITKIHDEVFLSYVIYCSDQLRTESQVEDAISDLTKVTRTLEVSKTEIDSLLSDITTIKSFKSDAETGREQIEELVSSMLQHQDKIATALQLATVNAQAITKYEGETIQQKTQIVQLAADAESADKKLKKVLKECTEGAANIAKVVSESSTSANQMITEGSANIDKILAEGSSMMITNKKHLDVIEQTLRMASKYGMAASFKERKDELKLSIGIWAGIFISAMLGIFITGIFYIVPHLQKEGVTSPADWAVKISLIAPLIWVGWMSARQYGYISRIREDYSFKYASALAFEGYKKEAAEVNADLLKDLLEVATNNMSLNPLRIYGEDSNHGSPFHELISKVADKVDVGGIAKDLSETVKSAVKRKVIPAVREVADE